jgi:general secretion pathway protein I
MKVIGNFKWPRRGTRDEGRENPPSASRIPRPAFQKGFTLLEVMIAMAIVAIALVTLMGMNVRSIEVNSRLQKITQATLLAQQRMSEIEVASAGGNPPAENEEGIFEPPFDAYRWRVNYEETPLDFLRLITVTVAWGDEGRNEMVDLTSFVF